MSTPAFKYLPPARADSLRGLEIAVRKPVEGGIQGLHRSPRHGSSVEFAEFREYTPGDPPNLIDWAVYARSDRYVIRKFEEETNVRARILLDISGSLDFRDEGTLSKWEYACHLAAGLMFILVNQGDSAGLMTFDSAVRNNLPPAGNAAMLRPLLLALESATPSGQGDIAAALHQAAEIIRSRSLVILISDLLQEPADILKGIRHLDHDGHDITILHILDPAELALTFGGIADIRELEAGKRLEIDADELRDAYAEAVRSYLDQIRRGCMDCMADYHLIDTRVPIEEALARRATRR